MTVLDIQDAVAGHGNLNEEIVHKLMVAEDLGVFRTPQLARAGPGAVDNVARCSRRRRERISGFRRDWAVGGINSRSVELNGHEETSTCVSGTGKPACAIILDTILP